MNLNQVGYATEALRQKAELLAKDLDFIVDKDACPCLYVDEKQLALKMPNFLPMSADFSALTWAKRASEGKKQGLVKAVKPAKGVKIIDATAGWGRDAAVLASLGAEVLMLERHAVMAALLEDALLHQSDKDRELLQLSLWKGSAHAFLSQLEPQAYPDVIYIDPMHPERNKSALVKKDLQALQQMIGADEDAADLITLARARVRQRVIVKWPQKAKPLLTPDASIEGKTVRFDIYLRATR